MKHLVQSILPLALLSTVFAVSAGSCCGGSSTSSTGRSEKNCCCTPHTMFIPRSVGSNTAREMLPYEHQYSTNCCMTGGLGANLAYQQTFDSARIARCLFGSSTLNFAGFESGSSDAIVADYFGLSTYGTGSISFRPKIQNFLIDFNLYLGFGGCASGLYFRAFAPMIWSQWKLQTNCGCGSCPGCPTPVTSTIAFDQTPFPAGYMNTINTEEGAPAALTQTEPVALSIQDALSGDFTFGDMQHKWSYGRFNTDCCAKNKWGIADVDLMLGYDFLNCEDYHVGIYLKGVCPTGTKIDSCYQADVFKPMIGNGRHWELGGGLSAHAELWNYDDNQKLTVYFEGDLTHMFQNTQVRSFDFTGKGTMSRYMLLKEYQMQTTGLTYDNHLFNAIDYATRCAKVSIGVRGDATLKFVYSNCGWNFGLGYNLYGSSKENVCIGGAAVNTLTGIYAFKGDAPVDAVGYTVNGPTAAPVINAAVNGVPTAIYSQKNNGFGLSTSESGATITLAATPDSAVDLYIAPTANTSNNGFLYVNPLLQPDAVLNFTNPPTNTIPNPISNLAGKHAFESSSTEQLLQQAATGALVDPRTYTPTTITPASLNKCSGAAAAQLVNKFFGTVGYEWKACDWKPFMDIGAEFDLASTKKCCSANQWGIWIRGGLGF